LLHPLTEQVGLPETNWLADGFGDSFETTESAPTPWSYVKDNNGKVLLHPSNMDERNQSLTESISTPPKTNVSHKHRIRLVRQDRAIAEGKHKDVSSKRAPSRLSACTPSIGCALDPNSASFTIPSTLLEQIRDVGKTFASYVDCRTPDDSSHMKEETNHIYSHPVHSVPSARSTKGSPWYAAHFRHLSVDGKNEESDQHSSLDCFLCGANQVPPEI
jgi:hypothetical protein